MDHYLHAGNFFLVAAGITGWNPALNSNCNHPSFVWEARNLLSHCQILLQSVLALMTIGVALGVYLALNPNWPETAVGLVITLFLSVMNLRTAERFCVAVCPLEVYHLPLPTRLIAMPNHTLSRDGREALRTRAVKRAKELNERRTSSSNNKSSTKRTSTNPNSFSSSGTSNNNNNSAQKSTTSVNTNCVGLLLRDAAIKCGRDDQGVSIYLANLEEDWYSDVDQLKGMAVDVLARYMPRRLAEEVHKELSVAITS